MVDVVGGVVDERGVIPRGRRVNWFDPPTTHAVELGTTVPKPIDTCVQHRQTPL